MTEQNTTLSHKSPSQVLYETEPGFREYLKRAVPVYIELGKALVRQRERERVSSEGGNLHQDQ